MRCMQKLLVASLFDIALTFLENGRRGMRPRAGRSLGGKGGGFQHTQLSAVAPRRRRRAAEPTVTRDKLLCLELGRQALER